MEDLAGGRVERDRDVVARACSRPRSIASTRSSSAASLESQVGREAALVADRRRRAPVVEQRALQRVVDLGAPAQRLGEAGRADRHDHELLEVDVVVGVGAAVEDVHHRHRQHVRRRRRRGSGRAAGRARWPPPGPRRARRRGSALAPRRALFGGAVEVDQRLVERRLVERVDAPERVGDLAVDVARRRAARPCRRRRCRRRAARPPRTRPVEAPDGTAARPAGARVERHLDLDRRVAAAVEDLARVDGVDLAHCAPLGDSRRRARA